MPFDSPYKVSIPGQDVLSWIFSFPLEDEDRPLFIDAQDPTRALSRSEIKRLVSSIAAGLSHVGVKPQQCVLVHSRNDIHLVVLALASLAIGAIYCPAPFYASEDELVYYMKAAEAAWAFGSMESISLVQRAAAQADLPSDHIFLFKAPGQPNSGQSQSDAPLVSYEDLIRHTGGDESQWVKFDDVARAKSETALRIFTSGSTGSPKAANLPHTVMTHTAAARNVIIDAKFEARYLHNLPLYHVTGWLTAASVLIGGGTMFISRKPDVETLVSNTEQFQITEFFLAPKDVLEVCRMVEEGKVAGTSLASVRQILAVGDSLPTETVTRIRRIGGFHLQISSGYGSTEAGGLIRLPYPVQVSETPFPAGPSLANVRFMLRDIQTGREIETYDKTGEIHIHSPGMLIGYHKNAKATAEAFLVDAQGVKWFNMGDTGFISSRTKYWTILGRAKDTFTLPDGTKIQPTEIEQILLTHPSILDAAIGPIEGKSSGHDDSDAGGMTITGVRAWIHAKDALKPEDVVEFLRSTGLSEKKLPEPTSAGVRFVSHIPRNPAGKLLRGKLEFVEKK